MKRIFTLAVAMMGLTAMAADNDNGLWTSVEASKSFSKKLKLEGELETRLSDNVSRVSRLSLQVGATYRLHQYVSVGAAYGLMSVYDAKYFDYQPRHRVSVTATGRYKLGRVSFSLRERIQLTTKDESDRIYTKTQTGKESKWGTIDTYSINPAWIWRNRLKLDYDIPQSPFTPFVSVETHYQLNNPNGNTFEGIRLMAGTEYKLGKQHSVSASLLFDREFADNANRQVLALGYAYKFR